MPPQNLTTPRLEARSDGDILWLIIANAKRRNAMTAAMWEAFPDLIGQAQRDENIRVVILRGEGEDAFCAGADISEFDEHRTGAAADRYNELNHNAFLALEAYDKPTIAMIHGFCLGGGLSLALSCDLRVASVDAKFSIPAAKLGIAYHPRWVTQILQAISPARAKEMLYTAERFDARWAHSVGLVNRLYAKTDLETETRSLARAIAENAPLSLKAAKEVVEALSGSTVGIDMGRLENLVAQCFDSEDYAEGRRAFEEKRKPKFQGR